MSLFLVVSVCTAQSTSVATPRTSFGRSKVAIAPGLELVVVANVGTKLLATRPPFSILPGASITPVELVNKPAILPAHGRFRAFVVLAPAVRIGNATLVRVPKPAIDSRLPTL